MRLRWEREGVKDICYNLLLAAAACPWPDRTAQLSDISSGATCVADLDSRALALTKEASGNRGEAAIPLFGHTEILHMLVSMGSIALVAAVVLPRYGGLNYACRINED